ncbi:MAG: hypothetical protein Q4B70_08165 [Lachnospiraceae bacterium]|nr:hypothetical protein [Lachnospiraceae bacterium]
MDYKTKPTSRKDLRRFSAYMRKLFDVPLTGEFPVLYALDKLSDVFSGCNYEVVDDKKLPPQTMARCTPNDRHGFTIEIKETVYNGAYDKQIGAFLGFICHEICHVFLFEIGFTPVFERSFADNELPAYCSVEWQAKALCAEVMVPYEETVGMKVHDIEKNIMYQKALQRAVGSWKGS